MWQSVEGRCKRVMRDGEKNMEGIGRGDGRDRG